MFTSFKIVMSQRHARANIARPTRAVSLVAAKRAGKLLSSCYMGHHHDGCHCEGTKATSRRNYMNHLAGPTVPCQAWQPSLINPRDAHGPGRLFKSVGHRWRCRWVSIQCNLSGVPQYPLLLPGKSELQPRGESSKPGCCFMCHLSAKP